MYLDLAFSARRPPTMVIMEVPSIDAVSLRGLLEGEDPGCLVLDCRSFFSFNSSHISGSTNVRFSTIVRRRARGGLGVGHIVPNEDTRNRLLSGEYRSVVFLDDRSLDFGQVKKDGTLMLAVTALCRDPCGASVFFLKGGFDTFSSEYPEMCTKPSAPQGLSLPLSARPDSADSPGSSFMPVEILPFLYLGSAYHASRKDMLDMLGITALINVSANCPNHFEESFQYKSIPVEDNHKADISSWFNEAIEFIDSIHSIRK
ncbi:hypothetical protein J4Q44_G00389680 [Coregonus suidteri]|uniref:protein-tyrosine-phosphatase n=1 Tax=Coregonus suidteri TaxID=861788 RepID=A0AAN8K8L7_9TELE